MGTTRRTFVKGSLLLGAAFGSGGALGCATAPRKAAGDPMPARSLLILGGTGFLGPQLVAAARARGHRLTLFNRGKTRPELFAGAEGVEAIQGDRNESLAALEATAELLAPNVGHYAFISSISVYADLGKAGVDEDSPLATIPDPTIEKITNESYGALKALCEGAAEAAMPGRVANIRPGLIVGPEDPTDRFTYWPVRIARGGEILAPGDGLDPVQLIDVRDLAEWTIRVAEQRIAGRFNALGPREVLPMRKLLEACAAGAEPKLTWVPAEFLERQKVSPWGDMPVWVPRGQSAPDAMPVKNDRAVAKGLQFRSAEATARDTLAWWKTLPPAAKPEEKEHPFRRTARLRAGIAPERESGVLAAWQAERAERKGA